MSKPPQRDVFKGWFNAIQNDLFCNLMQIFQILIFENCPPAIAPLFIRLASLLVIGKHWVLDLDLGKGFGGLSNMPGNGFYWELKFFRVILVELISSQVKEPNG